jgi:hypothetical protein
MKDKRKFLRVTKKRTTSYSPQEKIENIQDCTIIDVSRKGMQIIFPEKIDLGAIICLQLPVAVTGELAATTVSAQLKWIKKRGNDFIGGIELLEKLDDVEFEKLLIGYTLSEQKISTSIIKDVIQLDKAHVEERSPASISRKHPGLSSLKTALPLMNTSVSPLPLVLFSALTALLLMISGYYSYPLLNGDTQKNDTVVHRTEAPSSSEGTKTFSHQLISPAHAHVAHQNEPALPGEKAPHSITLREGGGNLYFLSMNHYQRANETLFDFILQANPSITDVRKIHDDQKITLPAITPESYITETFDGSLRVHVGTFDNRNVLALYSKKLTRLGKKPLVKPYQCSSKDTWHRLFIGDVTNREEALKTVNLLVEKDIIYIPPERGYLHKQQRS